MENQQEEQLTAEQLGEKKAAMLEFYTESLPYLDAQLSYENKLLAIDEARFKRMNIQMQYAMMMTEAKEKGVNDLDEEDDLELTKPARKLKKD
jgi:hypothetical protein